MKFENFVNSIKSKMFPVYYAKGEDSFLLAKTAEIISKNCGEQLPDFNRSVFDNEFFSIRSVLEACEQFPVIDEKRFIHIKDVNLKLSDNDKKEILAYVENPKDCSCLLITSSNTNSNWDFLKSKCEEIDCNKLSMPLALKFVVGEASKHGKKISEKAAIELVKACAFDLFKIKSEVHKLSSYDIVEPIIKSEMVSEMVEATNDYAVFELSDAIATKNYDKTWQMISSMMQEKKDATFGIISLVSNHFRRLLYASVSTLPSSEVASLLGVKEYAITKAREQKNKFSPVTLKKIIDICCEVEYNIKSGKMSSENSLTFFVVKLLGA
ncbi:MAG: DNA polymerase III subunit delta [Clostridia bacterium]